MNEASFGTISCIAIYDKIKYFSQKSKNEG